MPPTHAYMVGCGERKIHVSGVEKQAIDFVDCSRVKYKEILPLVFLHNQSPMILLFVLRM